MLRHSVINGCIVDMNTVYALHLMDGSENYLISNCNFMGRVDPEHPEQTPGSLIQIRGNQRSGVFTGLNLRNCSRHAIDIREGKFENGIFDAISMENIAMSTKDASVRGSYAGITFVGDYGHQAVVRGLSVDSHENTQAAISVGYASSNVTFFDVVTSGSIPIYYGSGCRTGQSAIMSGDDSAYLEFIDRTKIARGKIGSATVGKRGLLLEAGDTGPVIIANSLRPLDGSVSLGSTNYPFNYVACQQVVQCSAEP